MTGPGRDLNDHQRLTTFLERVRPRSAAGAAFGLIATYILAAPLDLDRMRSAWAALSERLGLQLDARGPMRSVLLETFFDPEGPRPWTADEIERQWRDVRLDPDRAAPAAVLLARLDKDRWLIGLRLHCLLTDGWGLDLVFAELCRLYDAPGAAVADGPSVRPRSPDVGTSAARTDFWRRLLAGARLPSRRALGFAPPDPLAPEAGEMSLRLDLRTCLRLQGLAADHGCTLSTVALAAWAGFLFSRLDDDAPLICPTLTLMRRTDAEAASFASHLDMLLVPMRATGACVGDLLVELQRLMIDVLEHELPLMAILDRDERLAAQLSDEGQLLMPFQAPAPASPARVTLAGVELEPVERSVTAEAGFSLALDALMTLHTGAPPYRLTLEFRKAALSPASAQALIEGFYRWLRTTAQGNRWTAAGPRRGVPAARRPAANVCPTARFASSAAGLSEAFSDEGSLVIQTALEGLHQ